MATPSQDPQQVFRSHLPTGTSLVVVFVPSKNRDDKPINQELWVDEVLRMGKETHQGEIGVVIDGKYYGITDFTGD